MVWKLWNHYLMFWIIYLLQVKKLINSWKKILISKSWKCFSTTKRIYNTRTYDSFSSSPVWGGEDSLFSVLHVSFPSALRIIGLTLPPRRSKEWGSQRSLTRPPELNPFSSQHFTVFVTSGAAGDRLTLPGLKTFHLKKDFRVPQRSPSVFPYSTIYCWFAQRRYRKTQSDSRIKKWFFVCLEIIQRRFDTSPESTKIIGIASKHPDKTQSEPRGKQIFLVHP